ncbi:hypothetical protein V8E36_002115 [Tilletia maclaganii]
MHIRVVLPIVALLFTWAGTTYAQEAPFVVDCTQQANHYCPHHPKSEESWQQYFQSCMQGSWASSVTDDKCPYRDVSCRCYNGCVKASWHYHNNVGGYCHAQCKPIDALDGC